MKLGTMHYLGKYKTTKIKIDFNRIETKILFYFFFRKPLNKSLRAILKNIYFFLVVVNNENIKHLPNWMKDLALKSLILLI